jgi:hypothetical protein
MEKYMAREIPAPENAHRVKAIGYSDQGGRPDGVQVMINKGHAFVGHVFSQGFSIVDVRDPRDMKDVGYVPAAPNTWNIHLQTHGDIMLVIEEFDFYSVYSDEKDYYGRSVNDVPDVPFKAGMTVYDIKNPAEPKKISFMSVDGKGIHRIWWDGGRYAYASVLPYGFTDHIFTVIDLNDITKPVEVGRWWMPGMWTASGEKPTWTGRWALHHAVVANDIAYCGWRDGGLVMLDVKDPTKPTLIAHRNWSPPYGGGSHSGMPLPGRGLCLIPDEATRDSLEDGLKFIWVADVRVPENPVTISTFPTPAEFDYVAKGGHFGPHNVHENRSDSFQSEELIFATYQNAGLRVIDLKNQYRPEEVGYWVPSRPKELVDDRPNRMNVIHSADVFVQKDGLIFMTDMSGAGLYALEYDGFK